jgi:hypothetical protein
MQFLAIIALCVVAAVGYGIIHDQLTARVCVEYFTIGHAPIFGTDDPTLLGLGWGVLATWWVGVMLGTPLAIVARAGRWPKRTAASLVRPLLVLMAASAVCALVVGLIGAALARAGIVVLLEPMASRVPQEQHVAFLADLWAHNASYTVGFIGGGIVMFQVWFARRSGSTPPRRKAAIFISARSRGIGW